MTSDISGKGFEALIMGHMIGEAGGRRIRGF
jgi:hypothetical protein